MKKSFIFLAVAMLTTAGFAQQQKGRKPGLYAVIDTTMGTFVCELYEKAAPLAVENFVGLARGTKEWLSPKGDMMKSKPYYDGIIFHRVVKDFMIQGGDITGKGTFTPVMPFKDEIVPSLRFDRPGVLAMAHLEPNTNRSQFFVTVKPQPHLNGKYTIFGQVVEGLDVVVNISNVQTSFGKPLKDVVMKKITIERVGSPLK